MHFHYGLHIWLQWNWIISLKITSIYLWVLNTFHAICYVFWIGLKNNANLALKIQNQTVTLIACKINLRPLNKKET